MSPCEGVQKGSHAGRESGDMQFNAPEQTLCKKLAKAVCKKSVPNHWFSSQCCRPGIAVLCHLPVAGRGPCPREAAKVLTHQIQVCQAIRPRKGAGLYHLATQATRAAALHRHAPGKCDLHFVGQHKWDKLGSFGFFFFCLKSI